MPPVLSEAHKIQLDIQWKLPETTGIAQLCDVQFCRVDDCDVEKVLMLTAAATSDAATGAGTPQEVGDSLLKWSALVTKRWEYRDFSTFSISGLAPGMNYVFRLRYRNNIDWSVFSPPSAVLRTLPDGERHLQT